MRNLQSATTLVTLVSFIEIKRKCRFLFFIKLKICGVTPLSCDDDDLLSLDIVKLTI